MRWDEITSLHNSHVVGPCKDSELLTLWEPEAPLMSVCAPQLQLRGQANPHDTFTRGKGPLEEGTLASVSGHMANREGENASRHTMK